MNTPNLNLNAVSAWLNHHKFLLTLSASLVCFGGAYFASAEELKLVEAKADNNAKVNRIQELRYHIDTLSAIKPEDRPPQIQRALDSYITEKKAIIGSGS